jgi:signal transduction histidine kinase
VVEIGTESSKRRRGPRRWSLSNWPVSIKVAAVVALPLTLAVFLGGLRIQSVVADASDLSANVEKSSAVSTLFTIDTVVGELAATGDPRAGEALAKILADAAVGERLENSEQAGSATGDLAAALAAAAALQQRLQSGPVPVADRIAVAEDTTSAVTALWLASVTNITNGLADDKTDLRTLATGIIDSLYGHRAAQTQQIILSEPSKATFGLANRAAGREAAYLDALSVLLGEDSPEITELRSQLDTRLAIYATASNAGLAEAAASAQRSEELYSAITERLVGESVRTTTTQADDRTRAAWIESAIVLAAVLIATLVALLVARSLIRPIRRLRQGALDVAHRALPEEIEAIRLGGDIPTITTVPVHTTEEIGQLARAVDDIHEEALALAGEQARLRLQVGNMFETLSRRSRSLVDHQLALIEDLERDEDDPRRLESLFRLDHLATRMRRNGANLMVLAGTRPRRNQNDQPVAVDTVLSAAVSEVEDYRRVSMLDVPDSMLVAAAASDIVHLLAELIDNALRYSPPDTFVSVGAARAVDGGILLEVVDSGLGMSATEIDEANVRLSVGGEVTPETARRMGLFVVGRLAQRHGVTVRLRVTQVPGSTTGVTAGVHIPVNLVVTSSTSQDQNGRGARRAGTVSSRAAANRLLDGPGTGQNSPTADVPSAIVSPARSASKGDHATADTGLTAARLPRRTPGASGVDRTPAPVLPHADAVSSTADWNVNGSPSDTSAFFSARPAARADEAAADAAVDRLTTNGRDRPSQKESTSTTDSADRPVPRAPIPEVVSSEGDPLVSQPDGNPIYERMVSEWLLDPAEARRPSGSWFTAADAGWAAAESATDSPITTRTESGLPARTPGARLVPGAVRPSQPAADRYRPDPASGPARNPEDVRRKFTNHFAGVRAGRSADALHRHRTEENE